VISRRPARRREATDFVRLRDRAEAVHDAPLCGVGQAAPLALRAALEPFPEALALNPA
jgi:hypothetical protein